MNNKVKETPGVIFLKKYELPVYNANKKMYFTSVTEEAIIAYNSEPDKKIRDKIYDKYIRYPFDKMVESIIHRFKFYYFDMPYDDVKNETISFLIDKIGKFNPDRNFKAFSYFSVAVKHYLIARNNKNYADMKKHADLSVIDNEINVTNLYYNKEKQEDLNLFMDMFVKYMHMNLYKIFNKQRDIQIADSIVSLFEDRQNIYSFNKKTLYVLIRERSRVKTQYITRVIGILKTIYYELYEEYQNTAKIDYIYKK